MTSPLPISQWWQNQVPLICIRSAQLTHNHNQIGYAWYPRRAVASFPVEMMDLVDAFRSNPKTYWTFLKCFTKKGALHPVLKDGNSLISDDVDRASLLNHVFASKFPDPGVASYPPVTQHHLPALNHIAVSPGTVCDILKSIHVTKACGPDGISARIVSVPLNCPCLWPNSVTCHCSRVFSHSNGNRQT